MKWKSDCKNCWSLPHGKTTVSPLHYTEIPCKLGFLFVHSVQYHNADALNFESCEQSRPWHRHVMASWQLKLLHGPLYLFLWGIRHLCAEHLWSPSSSPVFKKTLCHLKLWWQKSRALSETSKCPIGVWAGLRSGDCDGLSIGTSSQSLLSLCFKNNDNCMQTVQCKWKESKSEILY